jgi:drug/metabolite transporter (DMT)-like permease
LVHALFTFAQIGTFNWGTNLSLAGRASVFINVHPFVVAPLSWLFLGEKPGWKGIGGLIAAAGGIGILLGSRVDLAAGALLGDLVVIISGVIFGVQTVVQKRTFPSLSPATLLVNQAAMVVPMFLGYSLLFEAGEPWRFTRSATLGLLYQGLAVSGLCFSLWLFLVRRHRASQIATLAFLTPVFGVTFGSLFRGEPLGWPLVLSVALVGAGIYLVASERPAAPVGTGPEPIAPPEDGPVVATRA